MNLGFIILAIHEDAEQAPGGLEAEQLGQVALSVVHAPVWLIFPNLVDLVVSVDDLGDCHTQVPDNFRRTVLLGMQLRDYNIHDLFDVSSDALLLHDLALAMLLGKLELN
jgi:hypothetical protein